MANVWTFLKQPVHLSTFIHLSGARKARAAFLGAEKPDFEVKLGSRANLEEVFT